MKTHGMRARGLRGVCGILLVALLLISSRPLGSVSAAPLPVAGQAQAKQAPTVFACSQVSEIPLAECQALVALYNSTNGANWTNQTGWLSTTTPCSWHGVTCLTGHVITLTMNDSSSSGNGLIGSIPPELGSLVNLQDLDLSDNQLSGSIPPSWATWPTCLGST